MLKNYKQKQIQLQLTNLQMTQIFAGTAFGQIFTLRLDIPKGKQQITKYGIMKKERITSITLSDTLDQGLFYASQKNVYTGLYQDQTQQTIFSNIYNTSKIIGIQSYHDSIITALNNGTLVSISRDQNDQNWLHQQILGPKIEATLNKCYKKLVFDSENSFCLVGKEVLPFLYDSEKKLITWNGKNVPNDQLDLKVPVNDVDGIFFKNRACLACANADNKIRLYDVRTNRQKPSADYHLQLEKVYTKSNLTKIITSPYNNFSFYLANDLGGVYECDIRKKMQMVSKFKGINSTVTDLLIHDNKLIASSLDSYVRIFDLEARTLIEKNYMNKPVYSISVRELDGLEVDNQFKEEVLSDEEQKDPNEADSKKMKKLRKRNKVNLKYLQPVNWDEVPIKEELLQEAKEEYEQINSKDADSYLEEDEQFVKNQHLSDYQRDSDLD